ncbi:hypothetical protein CMQ_6511 [Grosmannia clavigera kw1407]|uniref:Uncharacterized protein n=1 Tax=Grosmannia clavigera (strain kw1407 / UAMH 11150) TaxID=655863 RepID=F0X7G2_GROCL|nr:uncharacterized protein CMQ_6511 [Grosmannia clavigera kw1407]EFX06190.1 hypothetical protein CMQ_6511 [Grosmannia clavigera kw1407]
MTKQRRPCRRAAILWLPFLLMASAANPTLANGLDIGEAAQPVPPIPRTAESDASRIGQLVRRLIAVGPDIIAADVPEQRRQIVRALEQDQEEREESRRKKEKRRVPAAAAAAAAAAAVTERAPIQTAAPTYPVTMLVARQNDGQVAALSAQIQSLSLASSAVSQASRLVSQTSQQLAQQVTQLSQSTDQLSQSIRQLQQTSQQLQQSAQQASQSAQQASQLAQQASQSAQQASQSATSAIIAAQASAASSASSAIALSLASLSSSVSRVIASASASAVNIASLASNQVQSAKADATFARADAATQVKHSQGTSVSVTQVALAVVVTFVGSVLLTALGFYLVTRCSRKGRRLNHRSAGYPRDLKLQNPPAGPYSSRTGYNSNDINDDEQRLNPSGNGGGSGANGRNSQQSSLYSRNSMQQSSTNAGFGSTAINSPPPPRRKDTINSAGGVRGRSMTSFSLFPKTQTPVGLSGEAIGIAVGSRDTLDMTPALRGDVGEASSPMYKTATIVTLAQVKKSGNNLTRPPPSLQQWLRQETMRPIGTGDEEMSTSWPFERNQQQPQTMRKQSVGAGGVNPGKVMQPGGPLPLRDS